MITKIKTIKHVSGLHYILMQSGDLFLVDFKHDTMIEPDYSTMNDYEIDQITFWFECIYDREENGIFQKRLKIKDIESLIPFGRVTSRDY